MIPLSIGSKEGSYIFLYFEQIDIFLDLLSSFVFGGFDSA